jgi:hypothetical protein
MNALFKYPNAAAKLNSFGLFAFFVLIISHLNSYSQNSSTPQKNAKKLQEAPIGKCWIKTDSSIIKETTKAELAGWVDKPPFILACENQKTYRLKFYEFTVLSLKPFENKSYGVGDERMIPILARKAIDNLKYGDTVILKDVELINQENAMVEKIGTISFKIIEKDDQK